MQYLYDETGRRYLDVSWPRSRRAARRSLRAPAPLRSAPLTGRRKPEAARAARAAPPPRRHCAAAPRLSICVSVRRHRRRHRHCCFLSRQAFGGIVTVSVGHCHPAVTEAMRVQSALLQHTTTIYLNDQVACFAEELAAKMPGELKVCYFVNSGSEANDLALLMARAYTVRALHTLLAHSLAPRPD